MNNSSIAPLDFYNKLTSALAKRKNLRIKPESIPGYLECRNKPRTKMLTDQIVQQNILKKYEQRKEFERREHQEGHMQPVQRNVGLNFKVVNQKLASIQANSKRKKPDNSYINLPPNFFKSYTGPDLSLFKIPNQPPKKQQQRAKADATSNFTIESLFSGNFKPQFASTPLKSQEQQSSEVATPESSFLQPQRESDQETSIPKKLATHGEDNPIKQNDFMKLTVNTNDINSKRKKPDFSNSSFLGKISQQPEKKPRTQLKEISSASDFTVGSEFSTNFKPPLSSTQNEMIQRDVEAMDEENVDKTVKVPSFFDMLKKDEQIFRGCVVPSHPKAPDLPATTLKSKSNTFVIQPAPHISDPDEILKEVDAARIRENEIKTQKDREAAVEIDFADLIKKVSKKWKNKSFRYSTHSMRCIRQKLTKIYDAATQSPRPSLLSPAASVAESTPVTQPVRRRNGFPLPEIYEDNENAKNNPLHMSEKSLLADDDSDIDDIVKNLKINDGNFVCQADNSLMNISICETPSMSGYPRPTFNSPMQCDSNGSFRFDFESPMHFDTYSVASSTAFRDEDNNYYMIKDLSADSDFKFFSPTVGAGRPQVKPQLSILCSPVVGSGRPQLAAISPSLASLFGSPTQYVKRTSKIDANNLLTSKPKNSSKSFDFMPNRKFDACVDFEDTYELFSSPPLLAKVINSKFAHEDKFSRAMKQSRNAFQQNKDCCGFFQNEDNWFLKDSTMVDVCKENSKNSDYHQLVFDFDF